MVPDCGLPNINYSDKTSQTSEANAIAILSKLEIPKIKLLLAILDSKSTFAVNLTQKYLDSVLTAFWAQNFADLSLDENVRSCLLSNIEIILLENEYRLRLDSNFKAIYPDRLNFHGVKGGRLG